MSERHPEVAAKLKLAAEMTGREEGELINDLLQHFFDEDIEHSLLYLAWFTENRG
ncbi:hypothetical protein [Longirhabdus pacifica]|uniref:hypothetical protein n=1 Tax=Longirhabdus pacifica TaxID=2305227 RepID=UPI0013E8B9C3|nr:hypothetical protein [Longirhabdus pacifica]